MDDDFLDYWASFHDMKRDRPVGMSMSFLPHSVIYDYAERAGLDSRETEAFVYVIKALDNKYISHHAENQAKKNK